MDLISALLLKSLLLKALIEGGANMKGVCPCCHTKHKNLVVDPKKKPGYEKLGKGTYKCKVCGAVIKVRGQ